MCDDERRGRWRTWKVCVHVMCVHVMCVHVMCVHVTRGQDDVYLMYDVACVEEV